MDLLSSTVMNKRKIFLQPSKAKKNIPIIPYDLGESTEDFNADITLADFHLAIQSAKNTTPGNDGITAKIFKILDPDSCSLLLNTFNDIWHTGNIPESWKVSTIIPIKKPNKPHNLYSSYRPIALTSVAAKVFERIINKRIIGYLISRNLINTNHYGFLPNRDCQSLLTQLHHEISVARTYKKFIMVVTLDIQDAYNSVWHDGLIYKCLNIGFRGRILYWLSEYLSNRSIQIKWRNTFSSLKRVTAGVDQGGVISPTLFTIYMSDLFEAQRPGVTIRVYADDIIITAVGDQYIKTFSNLQNTLHDLLRWCQYSKLQINPIKCKAIDFSRRKHPDNYIKICDVTIPWDKTICILGFHFNTQFNLSNHIKHLKAKAWQKLQLILNITSPSWGIPIKFALIIVNSLIRSLFDFGCTILSTANNSELKNLNIIYNKALRVALGLPQCTPLPVLWRIANQELLDARLLHLSRKCFLKNSAIAQFAPLGMFIEQHLTCSTKSCILEPHLNFMEFYQLSQNNILKIPWVELNISTSNVSISTNCYEFQSKNLPTGIIRNIWKEFAEDKSQNHTILSTDASKVPSQTTIAILDIKNRKKVAYIVHHLNSIFTAESMAILFAIKTFINSPGKFIILTDSLSSLIALENVNKYSPSITKKICLLLQQIPMEISIELVWVPGHSGIDPNEEADRLAKAGPFHLQVIQEIEIIDLVRQAKSLAMEEGWYSWHNSSYIFSHDYLEHIDLKAVLNFQLPRKQEIILCKWRAQQIATNSFLFKIKRRGDNLCDSCMLPEDPQHILLVCPDYINQRNLLMARLQLANPSYGEIMIKAHQSERNARCLIDFTLCLQRNF